MPMKRLKLAGVQGPVGQFRQGRQGEEEAEGGHSGSHRPQSQQFPVTSIRRWFVFQKFRVSGLRV